MFFRRSYNVLSDYYVTINIKYNLGIIYLISWTGETAELSRDSHLKNRGSLAKISVRIGGHKNVTTNCV